MKEMPFLMPDPDISLLDLRDTLLIRMRAIELIRRNIVGIMENSELDYLPSIIFLLDTIIDSSKNEVAIAFQAGRRTDEE